jgi:hypothetical protein
MATVAPSVASCLTVEGTSGRYKRDACLKRIFDKEDRIMHNNTSSTNYAMGAKRQQNKCETQANNVLIDFAQSSEGALIQQRNNIRGTKAIFLVSPLRFQTHSEGVM